VQKHHGIERSNNWRVKMAKMMKAAVVRAFGKPLVIEDAPVPTPGAGQVLVKIEACQTQSAIHPGS